MVGQNAWIAVCIMASARNGALYTGVTGTLVTRVGQHKLGTFEGFSKEYGGKTLVWYENHPTMPEAIHREKRIETWRRDWKLSLIETENAQRRDLSEGWFEVPEGPLSWTQRPQDRGRCGWVPDRSLSSRGPAAGPVGALRALRPG